MALLKANVKVIRGSYRYQPSGYHDGRLEDGAKVFSKHFIGHGVPSRINMLGAVITVGYGCILVVAM
jgi:hypothetical protein